MESYVVTLVGILALFGIAMFLIHVIRAKDTVHEVLTQARESTDNDAATVAGSPESMHSVGGH